MSSSNCCFLTCIQISQEAGQVVWYSHFFQNFPQFIVIHTVESFGIVNKAEIDVFLELSCFLDDPADIGDLISGSSAFSKTSFIIWKFSVHILLKPGLEIFEHYFTREWDECNFVVVQAFFGVAFLRDWNENWQNMLQKKLTQVPHDLAVSHLRSCGKKPVYNYLDLEISLLLFIIKKSIFCTVLISSEFSSNATNIPCTLVWSELYKQAVEHFTVSHYQRQHHSYFFI